MRKMEFGQMIFRELRMIGYEFDEEPDMIIDLIEELHDAILIPYPSAEILSTKEFDDNITFYFKVDDEEYRLNNLCWAVGINKKNWLRRTVSEPENLGAIVGKIRWIPQGC